MSELNSRGEPCYILQHISLNFKSKEDGEGIFVMNLKLDS